MTLEILLNMYIGAWQEYKLARIIQEQQKQIQQLQGGDSGPPRIRSNSRGTVSHRPSSAASSSASQSGLSTFSTQSAPAQLAARSPSAQAQLNTALFERSRPSERPRSAADRPRSAASSTRARPPRPSAKRSASRPPAGKAKSKPPSLEQARKQRIQSMQRLYGLGGEPQHEDTEASTTMGSALGSSSSAAGGGQDVEMPQSPWRPPAAAPSPASSSASIPAPQVTATNHISDLDRALAALRQTMGLQAEEAAQAQGQTPLPAAVPAHVPSIQPVPAPPTEVSSSSFLPARSAGLPPLAPTVHRAAPTQPDFRLPSLPEDNLGFEEEAGASDGLLQWSKGLQPNESPQTTLLDFLAKRKS